MSPSWRIPARLAWPAPLIPGLVVALTACAPASTATNDSVDEPFPTTIYRVAVEQCGGADDQRATAMAVAPGLAATVAHSLVGAKTVTLRAADGQSRPAEIVYLDPAKDVALLRLPPGVVPPPALGQVEVGQAVTIATYADDDGPAAKPATVTDVVVATLDGEGRRAAIKLEAEIEPGDSGAAVLADGRVVGMVFATARSDDVGWAIDASELALAVDSLGAGRPEAVPPAC